VWVCRCVNVWKGGVWVCACVCACAWLLHREQSGDILQLWVLAYNVTYIPVSVTVYVHRCLH